MRTASAFALSMLLGAVPAAAQQSHLVIVTGLSGEAKYSTAFHDWATTLIDAAQSRWGVPESNIVYLAENAEAHPGVVDDRSTRDNVEQTLQTLAIRAGASDPVFIILIGHGTTGEGGSKFNLPGPDMTAEDFAALLDAFPTQTVCFVNAASASGEFIPALSGRDRAVITATKTRYERNETIFAGFFVQAYAGEGADVDKDQRVSVLEAFNYASREVARAYESEGKLLTEHAILDDEQVARSLFLSGSAGATLAEATSSDPQLAALYQEKRALEEQVAQLRSRKDEMDPEVYDLQLEDLLVELALKTREIRTLEERQE
jgi:hypothetical protein